MGRPTLSHPSEWLLTDVDLPSLQVGVRRLQGLGYLVQLRATTEGDAPAVAVLVSGNGSFWTRKQWGDVTRALSGMGSVIGQVGHRSEPAPWTVPTARSSRAGKTGQRERVRGKSPSKPKNKGAFTSRERKELSRHNPQAADVSLYQNILAHLRALQWVYWTSHWAAAGPSYYGDHQLLQRLYEGTPSINDAVDSLGERMVSYFGPRAVNPAVVSARVDELVRPYREHSPTFQEMLLLEGGLNQAVKKAWQANQNQQDTFSLGMDDFLMSLANERDTAMYLLQQRARTAKANPTGAQERPMTVCERVERGLATAPTPAPEEVQASYYDADDDAGSDLRERARHWRASGDHIAAGLCERDAAAEVRMAWTRRARALAIRRVCGCARCCQATP